MSKKEPSRYPSTDPRHECGMFCDGQDGYQSDCARAKRGLKPQQSPRPMLPSDDPLIDEDVGRMLRNLGL